MMGCRVPVAGIASIVIAALLFPPAVAAQSHHDALVAKHAATHGVPESLVRRVIHIESRGNPRAVSKGNYGLMQIRLGTARAMGYRGDAKGLLDADTNMAYAVKYLAGAYRAAGCSEAGAIRNYQKGYHGVRRVKCRTPHPTQVASAETNGQTQYASAAPAARIADAHDVIKPRVVQTVAISSRGTESARPPRVAAGDPDFLRQPPLPVAKPKPAATEQTVAAVRAEPDPQTAAMTEMPSTLPPVALPAAHDVPLPPVRAARLDPEPPKTVSRAPQAGKRARARGARKTASKSDSGDLASIVRRLITPDRKSRGKAVAAGDRHAGH